MADLFSLPAAEEAQGRRRQMLRTAFGPTIAAALSDPTVIEVMVNPDGKLWIERATDGRRDTGERIGSAEAERIIRLVAAHNPDLFSTASDDAPLKANAAKSAQRPTVVDLKTNGRTPDQMPTETPTKGSTEKRNG